jgi:pyruvate,water dikinase
MQVAFHHQPMATGLGRMFAKYGIPLRTYEYRLVNGRCYSRLIPLVGPEKDATKAPPAALLWLAMRVHPEFRARARNAAAALEARRWRAELTDWDTHQRAEWRARNRSLQGVDLARLDAAMLATHMQECFAHACAGHELHFELHGTDMVPLGDLFAHGQRWGITANEIMATLQGSSPASVAASEALAVLARIVAAAPDAPRDLDDVRSLGAEASAALDDFLAEYGWRMVTNYDIDGRCLIELPDAILAAINAAATDGRRAPAAPDEDFVAALRARVPDGEGAIFDALLTEGRLVFGLRDDNGPLTVAWPVGLVRRAVLEGGRRLVAAGALHDAEHAVELTLDELVDAITGAEPLDADAIATRARDRAALAAAVPPVEIGPPEPDPPLAVMPAPLRRMTEIAIAATTHLEAPPERTAMEGLGIGTKIYTGRARVSDRVEDVLSRMEPGDVLVAASTTPAYNVVLAIAGAVVCEEGGALCHTAVMAREFGFPAVVGARGAMSRINDGDRIEVDPIAGRVRVVAGAG